MSVKIPAQRAGLWEGASVRGHVAAMCCPQPQQFASQFCKRTFCPAAKMFRNNSTPNVKLRGQPQSSSESIFGIALFQTPFRERGFTLTTKPNHPSLESFDKPVFYL